VISVRPGRLVRFVPMAEVAAVASQMTLIRPCAKRRRDFNTERFRCLEIKSERVQRQKIRPTRSYPIMTGLVRAIRPLSLLAARMAKPSGNGLFRRQKATFFT
jgi:hypothetical protein